MSMSSQKFLELWRAAKDVDKLKLADKYPTQFNEMIKLNPAERIKFQGLQYKAAIKNNTIVVNKQGQAVTNQNLPSAKSQMPSASKTPGAKRLPGGGQMLPKQPGTSVVPYKQGTVTSPNTFEAPVTTSQTGTSVTPYQEAIYNQYKPSAGKGNILGAIKNYGGKALNIAGKAIMPLMGVTEAITSNEPMGKVLGGVTALSPLAGPYAGIVGGSALVGSGIIDNAKNIANKISDKIYQNWERQYGSNQRGLPSNLENIDPSLKQLTKDQLYKAEVYDTNKLLSDYHNELEDYQNALRQEASQEQEMVDAGQQNIDLLNRQTKLAEDNLRMMDNINSGNYQLSPPPSQPQYQGIQNPYPGVVPMSSNNIPVQQELQGNQQMVDNNLPYNLSTQYRQGANAGLSDLFNSLQGVDNTIPEKDYSSSIDNYMNILNSAYSQQQQNQEQLQKQLQSARKYDALNNAINQFAYLQDKDNAARMRAFIPNGRGGYDLINLGGEGTLDKPERVSTAQQYEQAIADNSKTTQEYLQKLAELQQASDLADMYGGSPLAYVNPDLAKEIVKGTYDVKGITEKGVQERKTLPYKTGADIITKQAEQAGQLDIENLKGKYGLAQEDVKGRYDYSTEGLKQANENQRSILQANLARELQGMKNEQILQVAKQYGANAMQLAQLKDQLEQNNPVARARAIGSLAAGVSAMPDPSMLGEITGSIPDYEAILFGNSSLGDNATQKQNDILNKYGL